jgi:hypothetical protein
MKLRSRVVDAAEVTYIFPEHRYVFERTEMEFITASLSVRELLNDKLIATVYYGVDKTDTIIRFET